MYLKKIEMRGFKSFADETFIDFRGGITCIVGPNGSGKSNITDGARWVLGEQKIKTLRGSKMEDVIFSGTKHRKSLGLAEVKMVFDNSDNFFKLDYDEVEISRRMYRSGESEFKINNMPCRLKDVRELLMDTGIGKEGYSIIGQGKIDEVLSNKTEERRQIFEEAAGIVKYKKRKQEAVRKLENTDTNLIRIDDIVSELFERIEPLKLESENAKKFIELDTKLKTIELSYFAKRYEVCEKTNVEIIDKTTKANCAREEYSLQKEKIVEVHTKLNNDISAISRNIRMNEDNHHSLENVYNTMIGERDVVNEKVNNSDRNIKRIEYEVENLLTEEKNIADTIEKNIEEKEKIIENIARDEEKIELEQNKMSLQENEYNELITQNEENRNNVINLMNEVEVKKSEIRNIDEYQEDIYGRITNIENSNKGEQELIDSISNDLSSLEEKFKSENEVVEKTNEIIASLIKDNISIKKKHEKISEAITSEKYQNSKYITEVSLLKQLEKEYDGFDKGVKEILKLIDSNKEYSDGVVGTVASLLNVPKKVEKAIEIALGKSMQHIVCSEVKYAKMLIEYLKKNRIGRVTFIPLDNIQRKGDQDHLMKKIEGVEGYLGKANHLISYDDQYDVLFDFLLGRIIVVEDFNAAQEMLKIKTLKYKVITLAGEILIPGGTITGGHFNSRISNILGRKRKIEELENKIVVSEGKLEEDSKELKKLDGLLVKNESDMKDKYSIVDQLKLSLVKLENEIGINRSNYKRISENITKQTASAQILKEEYEKSLKKSSQARSFIKKAQIDVENMKEKMNLGSGDLDNLTLAIEEYKERITAYRIEIASHNQKLEFKSNELCRLKDENMDLEIRIKRRREELEEYSTKFSDFNLNIESMNKNIDDNKVKINLIGEKIVADRSRKIEMIKELKEKEAIIEELALKINEINEENHTVEIKRTRVEVEKELIINELWEKYEKGIAEILNLDRIDVSKAEVKNIKNQLKSLGEVNTKSIKEYEEVKERYDFLTKQKNDLVKSKEDLLKIIVDLDKKMEILFEENFKVINKNFKETFASLFGGGDADLLITDYENILTCDIDIIAQPPGKKLQSITLLSGGEKALTAIALLFAILKCRPSPFCILDEIEAALDDVNVYRFAQFIKEYSERSQFVLITHRKGTMEIADDLYGVTMEEYGVSKILSIKLEDYNEE